MDEILGKDLTAVAWREAVVVYCPSGARTIGSGEWICKDKLAVLTTPVILIGRRRTRR